MKIFGLEYDAISGIDDAAAMDSAVEVLKLDPLHPSSPIDKPSLHGVSDMFVMSGSVPVQVSCGIFIDRCGV